MSIPSDRSRQLAYLKSASEYLAFSSPSTSAYLGSERVALMLDPRKDRKNVLRDRKALRDQLCTACGTLTIIGWTAALKRGKEDLKRSKLKVQKLSGRKTTKHSRIIHVCGSCHSEMVTIMPTSTKLAHALPTRKPLVTTTASKAQTPVEVPVQQPESLSVASEKMSSKQRAKARKEKSGLQALLAKSKQSATASSSTFNLMDFMKA